MCVCERESESVRERGRTAREGGGGGLERGGGLGGRERGMISGESTVPDFVCQTRYYPYIYCGLNEPYNFTAWCVPVRHPLSPK